MWGANLENEKETKFFSFSLKGSTRFAADVLLNQAIKKEERS